MWKRLLESMAHIREKFLEIPILPRVCYAAFLLLVLIVVAPGGVKMVVGDGLDEVAISIGSTPRYDARRRTRRLPAWGEVISEMEAAAVKAFLAGADTARLGRSLAEVYVAMDAVRRRQDAPVDDGS